MALPTFLELVNDVLVRLREPEVATVNENVLSKVIGKFVNDAKRQVEDAYNWNALTDTLTATTTANTFNYTLIGSGARFKLLEVYDVTNRSHLTALPTVEMTKLFISTPTPNTGEPAYYNFNGIDNNGDTAVDLYPIPDAAYSIYFNIYKPQATLSTDSSIMLVPSEPVIHLATAKALVERGEDGGTQSSEMYALYKQVLADYIAIESSRYPEEDSWDVV